MSEELPVVSLAEPGEAYHFRVGMPLVLDERTGIFRRVTWRDRVRMRLLRWTRWWRPRFVVVDVDRAAGAITMVQERWSWWRWKWVRA